jgi:hypothetical protein
LPAAIPLDSLQPISHAQPYGGAITIWQFQDHDFARPELVAHIRPEYKPQHVIWYRGRLWILGVDRLEVVDETLSRVGLIEDPWLSGAHTVQPDGHKHLLVTCSASDSVLLVDEATYTVASALRLPERIYGRNFPITRHTSLVDHYIHNDLQLTHVDCASPWRGGIVVSTLIQGAIGWFYPSTILRRWQYRELLRGFVGCHGVRVDARTDHLYFSDSCQGTLVFLDKKLGIRERVGTGSVWLHDSLQLEQGVFGLAVSDANRLRIMDTCSREVMADVAGDDFGLGPQFLYYGQ